MLCAFSRETKIDVTSVTDLEEEEIVLAIGQSTPPWAETQSSQQCMK